MKFGIVKALAIGTLIFVLGLTDEASAQGFRARIHDAHANSFGGANCGRGISHADAEGLWANYCFDDCTINSGHCGGRCGQKCGGGCGFGHSGGCFGGGPGLGGHNACECGGNVASDCGFGPRFGHHHRNDCGGCGNHRRHRGFVSGGSNCFGWPAADCGCDNSGFEGQSRVLSHHGRRHQVSCNSSCGLLASLGHHRHQNWGGANSCDTEDCGSRLLGCGHKCRLFDRHHCNFDACSPITSQVSARLGNGCGCN
jgi:hypothetical protein